MVYVYYRLIYFKGLNWAMRSVNLGAYFDKERKMDKKISEVSSICFYHLRNISRIRKFLTEEACKTLVQALVISRLYYANALLYVMYVSSSSRLQRVQHAAARLVMKARWNDHITTALQDLRWLPIRKRIEYKILILVFKALQGLASPYITEMLSV